MFGVEHNCQISIQIVIHHAPLFESDMKCKCHRLIIEGDKEGLLMDNGAKC